MSTRLNRCLLCVGRRGTGKTTIALKLANSSGKRIIVVDTDDHPTYADFPIIPLSLLPTWRGNKGRVIDSNTDEVFRLINLYQSNAFIIAEDAAKYVNGNVQKAVKAFIIDHRKRNFDLLLMFHFLSDVPPYIAKQYDVMILFKTGDNLHVTQNKFANWHTIAKKLERILKHKSFNYCETVAIDE